MRSLLTFILVMAAVAMNAQESAELNPRLQWGVSASFDMDYGASWTSTHTSPGIYPGFTGGGAMRVMFPKGWLINTGVKAGYTHRAIDAATDGNRSIVTDSWRIGIPVTAGYKFDLSKDFGIAPLAGLEYNYYFYTSTAHLPAGVDLSSSQLWRKNNLDWCVGAALIIDTVFEVDILADFSMFRANKKQKDLLFTRNFMPCSGSVTLKMFF